jgi:hypothetical protein
MLRYFELSIGISFFIVTTKEACRENITFTICLNISAATS